MAFQVVPGNTDLTVWDFFWSFIEQPNQCLLLLSMVNLMAMAFVSVFWKTLKDTYPLFQANLIHHIANNVMNVRKQLYRQKYSETCL